jgi:lipid-binding SYLF domain-containing protein
MIIVIHSEAALRTFMSGGSLSLGAEVGLSIGPFGRTAAAELRANEEGVASTSSYSQSKVKGPGIHA